MRWSRSSLSTLAVSFVALAGAGMVAASVHGVTKLDGDLAAAAQRQQHPAVDQNVRYERQGPSTARDCPYREHDRRPSTRPTSFPT